MVNIQACDDKIGRVEGPLHQIPQICCSKVRSTAADHWQTQCGAIKRYGLRRRGEQERVKRSTRVYVAEAGTTRHQTMEKEATYVEGIQYSALCAAIAKGTVVVNQLLRLNNL